MQLLGNHHVNASYTNSSVYKIGDLAREFKISLRTLRFYEDKGFVTPSRSGTTRLYSAKDRENIKFTLFCKRIGLPLNQVRTMLDLHNQQNSEARSKLLEVFQVQMDALENMQRETQSAMNDLKELIAQLEAPSI